jgi:hypothetical protein
MKRALYIAFSLGLFTNAFSQSISLQPNFFQLPRVATNPACAVADKGKMIFNTNQNKILYCNGSAWINPESGVVAPITPAFFVRKSGLQTVRSEFEIITFPYNDFDLTNSFNLDDVPTDPNTFVSPDDGIYQINFDTQIDMSGFVPTASTQITLRLTKSTDGSFQSFEYIFPVGDNSEDNYIHLSRLMRLPQGAKVRIYVNIQNAPTWGALKLDYPTFSGHLVSWY